MNTRDVIEGIVNLISADPGVTELITTYGEVPAVFYNNVPEDADRPYVLIRKTGETPKDTHSRKGSELSLEIRGTDKTALGSAAIADAIEELLHLSRPSIEGVHVAGIIKRFASYEYRETYDIISTITDYSVIIQEST